MAKAKKSKTAAAKVAVPQSRAEAAEFIRRIGEANRQVVRLQAAMNDRIAAVKAHYEASAAPAAAEAEALTTGLATWCEANRAAITGGDKKSADLGTGIVKWRLRPPSVRISGVEAVIERLRAAGLGKFLRDKSEINKEAMQAEPDLARGIVGVTIGSAGEDFVVEPFEASLTGQPEVTR